MEYHKTVFKKYAIKVTNDPFPKDFTVMEEEAIEHVYMLINNQTKVKNLSKQVKEFKDRYSDLPEMYNYLGGAYLYEGKQKEAMKVIKETIRRFPDYEFGKLQWAELSLKKGNHEEVPKVLGLYTEINKYANEEGFVHSSFYLAFFTIQGRYFLAINDIDKAKECLGKILTYSKTAIHAEELAIDILQHTLQSVNTDSDAFEEFDIEVEDKATYLPLQVNIKPTFFHPEIELFYKNDFDSLSINQIKTIINLPKDSLIKDLELVIEDTIVRYQWFSNHYDEWNDDEQSAAIHALKFLCALKSEQSLQKVFNLLRQKNDLLDYWFEDIDLYFDNYLFSVSKNKLKEFHNFIYESYTNPRSKSLVIDTLSQCYFHYPEIEEEFLSILTEMSDFFKETKDVSLFDTRITMALVGVYLDHNLTEFIPYVETFFDNNWVDPSMYGDKKQVIKDIKSNNAKWRKESFPNNIFEDYSGEYIDRKEKDSTDCLLNNDELEVQDFLLDMMLGTTANSNIDNKYLYEDDDYYGDYEVVETYKREQPKVGRNEPCPCGSGKKYKKCCINK